MDHDDFPVGQGHGIEGHFAGLPEEFSNLKDSKIVIFQVPFDKTTTYQQGTDKGPAALIEASRNLELYHIPTGTQVYEHGIYTFPAIEYRDSEHMLESTYEQVLELLRQGKFVVTLGGEHSISAAPIRAHAEFFKSGISVLQFDAHADLQPAYEGNPLSHASVMARVIEIPSIKGVTAVGIRSMSSEELENQKQVKTFFCHDLFDSDAWMDDVVNSLSDQVYLTFDLDVFDSSVMPSTGTPEPGGLFWHQVLKLLRKVIQKKNLIGCDIVELLPNEANVAPDFLAARLVYEILSYKFKYNS